MFGVGGDVSALSLSPTHPAEMFSLFTSRQPPEKPDVDVVPLLPLDAETKLQSVMVTYMFTFDGKLDVERLRTSLYDLIKYKWRILGARLVYNVKVVFKKNRFYLDIMYCNVYLFACFPDERSGAPCSPFLRLVEAALLI
jgi:hypothetical protein